MREPVGFGITRNVYDGVCPVRPVRLRPPHKTVRARIRKHKIKMRKRGFRK